MRLGGISIIKASALGAFLLLMACGGSDRNAQLKKIDELEALLYSDTATNFNQSKAEELLKYYIQFSQSFPQDSISPDYILKTGQICLAIKKNKDAFNYFSQITEKYPNSKHAPYALFMQAFSHDNENLKDSSVAGFHYRKFLKKYPMHPLAASAEASLRNLGKSDLEIIREFEAKQQEKLNN